MQESESRGTDDGTENTDKTDPPPSADPGAVLAEGTSESSDAASHAIGEGAAGEVKEVKDPWWKFW